MLKIENSVEELSGLDPAALPDAVLSSTRPLLLRGLVAGWPLVPAGVQSAVAAMTYLKRIKIGKQHSILIKGASGSIGSSGVQLARHFGIQSLEEARAYLEHSVLGSRLVACTEALLAEGSRKVRTRRSGKPCDARESRHSSR